ncbi:MAG: hypothetical protein KDB05_11895 [Planctomycetales bacterium]|nr:hypothetical protein [Planctomycetales bacterium]
MTSTAITTKKKPVTGLLLLLFGLPLALILTKSLDGLPFTALAEHCSLESLPEALQTKIAQILLVPLCAVLVAFVRLTLGLRLLGPFRSILLAVAFQATGLVMGLVLFAGTVAVLLGARPWIKALRMPYYGRTLVTLSCVCLLMTAAVMVGEWLQLAVLQSIVFLPVVVMCLIGDAIAKTARREGTHSAIWRSGLTAAVAVVLAAVSGIPAITELMVRYPELLLSQIGMILVVSRYMGWRWFANYNPLATHAVRDEDEEDDDEPREKSVTARDKSPRREPQENALAN